MKLGDVRPGAIFRTKEGVMAVKTEYYYTDDPDSQCQCVLLSSGEYAHFPNKDNEDVIEIDILNREYDSMKQLKS